MTDDLTIKTVEFKDDRVFVELNCGFTVTNVLEDLPKLKTATVEQRSDWKITNLGKEVHWDSIGERIIIQRLSRDKKGKLLGVLYAIIHN